MQTNQTEPGDTHPEARDHVDEFMAEAMSGDYNHLLRTAMEWVNVS